MKEIRKKTFFSCMSRDVQIATMRGTRRLFEHTEYRQDGPDGGNIDFVPDYGSDVTGFLSRSARCAECSWLTPGLRAHVVSSESSSEFPVRTGYAERNWLGDTKRIRKTKRSHYCILYRARRRVL